MQQRGRPRPSCVLCAVRGDHGNKRQKAGFVQQQELSVAELCEVELPTSSG